MESDYRLDVTEETHKELVEFIQWYNEVQGHVPLIVGGWAAWAYHRGLGSKDIDVIFPGSAAKHVTLSQYFKSNGYAEHREIDSFDFEFTKTRVTSDGRKVNVIVDAASMDRNVQVSGTDLIIPWSLAEKYKRRFSFGKNADAYIVDPELLLVYKVGALVGRDFKRKTAVGFRRAHYESKLWKDARDVLGVFENCELDEKLLGSLLESCGLDVLLGDALEIAGSHFDPDGRETFEKRWAGVFRAARGNPK